MSWALSRALMHLAICGLGEARRDWANAMLAEYETVARTENPLIFAAGCLLAAWRDMPRHVEGRFGLATHMLSLGVLVPIAFLQFAYALGLLMGPGGRYFALVAAGSREPLLASAQLGAIPALLTLWTSLGIAHLQLAWVLLDRDWDRIVRTGSAIAAVTLTLFTFMQLLMLQTGTLMVQAGALALELAILLAIARWHGRIFTPAFVTPSSR